MAFSIRNLLGKSTTLMLERLVAPHLKGKNGANTLNIMAFSLMTLQMPLSIMNLLGEAAKLTLECYETTHWKGKNGANYA